MTAALLETNAVPTAVHPQETSAAVTAFPAIQDISAAAMGIVQRMEGNAAQTWGRVTQDIFAAGMGKYCKSGAI
jgi:hypothetical protein